jgi:hypothetical protein
MSGVMLPIMGELAQMSSTSIVNITDPTQLPTLQVWYNADKDGSPNFNKINGSGGDVSQWTDRSGTGHNANQAGSNVYKPNWYSPVLNGNGAIRFNGTTESLSINPFAFAQSKPGFTMYVVAQASNIGVTARTLTSSDTEGYRIFHNGTNWCVKASNGQGNTTVTGDTSWHIFGLVFNGNAVGNSSRLQFRYDSVDQPLAFNMANVGTTTSAVTTTFWIGEDNGAEYFAGNVAEVLMFTRTLSSGEILGVEQYLRNHWAL